MKRVCVKCTVTGKDFVKDRNTHDMSLRAANPAPNVTLKILVKNIARKGHGNDVAEIEKEEIVERISEQICHGHGHFPKNVEGNPQVTKSEQSIAI